MKMTVVSPGCMQYVRASSITAWYPVGPELCGPHGDGHCAVGWCHWWVHCDICSWPQYAAFQVFDSISFNWLWHYVISTSKGPMLLKSTVNITLPVCACDKQIYSSGVKWNVSVECFLVYPWVQRLLHVLSPTILLQKHITLRMVPLQMPSDVDMLRFFCMSYSVCWFIYWVIYLWLYFSLLFSDRWTNTVAFG